MFNETISKCIIQVKRECHFFGALMLFAEIHPDKSIDTAATDGKKIIVNEKFLASLKSSEQNALLLHEVLHMALLHVTRRGPRDPYIWNIAADIVVNDLIIRNTKFKLPKGAVIESRYKDKSVEHIYEDLLKKNKYKKIIFDAAFRDILIEKIDSTDKDKKNGKGKNDDLSDDEIEDIKNGKGKGDDLSDDEIEDIETFWSDKLQVLQNDDFADQKYGSNTTGGMPMGMAREVESILEPEIDWRHALWKYVGKTPADFDDLDRRFLYRGLYLEGLLTEALEVSVCVDTSGSVSEGLIDQFVAEIKGILSSYPHVKCDFFFCDTELSGPFEISSFEEIPLLKGGGGTSFKPFFKYLEKENNNLMGSHKISIYLTDGYEEFPKFTPKDPVMWLVSKDGEETSKFPFGEVVRISTESWDY